MMLYLYMKIGSEVTPDWVMYGIVFPDRDLAI